MAKEKSEAEPFWKALVGTAAIAIPLTVLLWNVLNSIRSDLSEARTRSDHDLKEMGKRIETLEQNYERLLFSLRERTARDFEIICQVGHGSYDAGAPVCTFQDSRSPIPFHEFAIVDPSRSAVQAKK